MASNLGLGGAAIFFWARASSPALAAAEGKSGRSELSQ